MDTWWQSDGGDETLRIPLRASVSWNGSARAIFGLCGSCGVRIAETRPHWVARRRLVVDWFSFTWSARPKKAPVFELLEQRKLFSNILISAGNSIYEYDDVTGEVLRRVEVPAERKNLATLDDLYAASAGLRC